MLTKTTRPTPLRMRPSSNIVTCFMLLTPFNLLLNSILLASIYLQRHSRDVLNQAPPPLFDGGSKVIRKNRARKREPGDEAMLYL